MQNNKRASDQFFGAHTDFCPRLMVPGAPDLIAIIDKENFFGAGSTGPTRWQHRMESLTRTGVLKSISKSCR